MNLKENLLKLDININIDDSMIEKFETYYKKLIEVNSYMNLTRITEYEDVYIKHFLDSLTILKFIKDEKYNLCDVGSGAGFPSIPLAITNDKANFTIIDSLNKRINFINDLVSNLNLNNVEAYHFRAEDYAKDHKETFDYVTARAVARLNVLIELCLPLVKIGGFMISMKGDILPDEIEEAKKGIELLGGKVQDIIYFNLPIVNEKRALIVIKKIKNTPKGYPREFKKIKDRPLWYLN